MLRLPKSRLSLCALCNEWIGMNECQMGLSRCAMVSYNSSMRHSEHIHTLAPNNNNKGTFCRTITWECGDDCEARPPARRRGSPRPRPLQPPCWTSPQWCFATIVGVSARCASRFCEVAVADSSSQCNWPSWRGHA